MKTIRLAACLLALFVGCAHEEPASQSWNGLSVKLTLLDVRSSIGRPVRVRVDLVNNGPTTMFYDAQGVDYGSFEVKGPAEAPLIAEHGQTFGFLKPLMPGQSVALLDQYDLATEYLIDAPGTWRVRFKSSLNLSEKEQRGDPGSCLMVSDWVEIPIDEAKPAPWMQIARRLHDSLRSRWQLTVSGVGAGTRAVLRSPDFILDRPFRKVLLRIGPTPAVEKEERLCPTRWGDAFVFTEWPALDQAWADCRAELRAVLTRP